MKNAPVQSKKVPYQPPTLSSIGAAEELIKDGCFGDREDIGAGSPRIYCTA
jgi:hypothetical protein